MHEGLRLQVLLRPGEYRDALPLLQARPLPATDLVCVCHYGSGIRPSLLRAQDSVLLPRPGLPSPERPGPHRPPARPGQACWRGQGHAGGVRGHFGRGNLLLDLGLRQDPDVPGIRADPRSVQGLHHGNGPDACSHHARCPRLATVVVRWQLSC